MAPRSTRGVDSIGDELSVRASVRSPPGPTTPAQRTAAAGRCATGNEASAVPTPDVTSRRTAAAGSACTASLITSRSLRHKSVCMLADRDLPPKYAMPPVRLGRWPDWSDVGCSHARECPLFPLLNASLRDWRNYYCDSADGWQQCARYQLSRTGQLVPITLLPNGADAVHLRGIPARDGSEGVAPAQAPSSRPGPGRSSRFEPAPAPASNVKPTPTPPKRRRWWTRLADWIAGPA